MDLQKVAVVQKWPVLSSVVDIDSFLGLCKYYRCFVSGFDEIASLLFHLTSKGAHFEWRDKCQEALFWQELGEAPELPFPDSSSPYLIDTDASISGLCSILSQVKDGKELILAFYSAKFTKTEHSYTMRKLLAVIKSSENFHSYTSKAPNSVCEQTMLPLAGLRSSRNPKDSWQGG